MDIDTDKKANSRNADLVGEIRDEEVPNEEEKDVMDLNNEISFQDVAKAS